MEPKTSDIFDAIRELKFWLGVELTRFDYPADALNGLFLAIFDFLRAVAPYRQGDVEE